MNQHGVKYCELLNNLHNFDARGKKLLHGMDRNITCDYRKIRREFFIGVGRIR